MLQVWASGAYCYQLPKLDEGGGEEQASVTARLMPRYAVRGGANQDQDQDQDQDQAPAKRARVAKRRMLISSDEESDDDDLGQL